MGGREDQGEEDLRKTSKLIAYLSTKSESCKIVKMRKCNALSNRCTQNLNHL